VPPLGQSEWRAPSAVYDVKSANLDRFQLAPTTSQAQAPVRAVVLTTTRWPALANAQHTIASRLPISMDMSVCGSSVQTLIRNWDLALTQEHFAMLASDHGVRLEGTLLPLEKAVKIDRSRSVLDYRTVVKR
jgi:hypothetical protein